MAYTSRKRRVGRNRKRRLAEAVARYLILYVRSPAALLDDLIFSPPLLPRIADEAPDGVRLRARCFRRCALARFMSAITSAFLLVRSAFGLLVGFLAGLAFFAGLACIACSSAAPFPVLGLRCSLNRLRSLVSIDRVGRHIDRSGSDEEQAHF